MAAARFGRGIMELNGGHIDTISSVADFWVAAARRCSNRCPGPINRSVRGLEQLSDIIAVDLRRRAPRNRGVSIAKTTLGDRACACAGGHRHRGAAVLIGAGLAYLQFTKQQETAREQLQASVQQVEQQQRAAHELLISNQVSKGFELLGSDKVVVRLGGIYALEGVMNTSGEYHQSVLEGLCGFVREQTKAETDNQLLASDIQAALTVIGRRAAIGTGDPHLSHAHVPKANLNRANLTRADLTDANLSDADLTGANLTGANLTNADLTGANLSDTILSQMIELSDDPRDPRHHVTSFSTVRYESGGADLTGADLFNAKLSRAKLHHAKLKGADLRGSDLSEADLGEADLARAALACANLARANLRDAYLGNADLTGATVSQMQLDKACGKNVGLDRGLIIKQCDWEASTR
jgi:uncharacterized protein YjbI with pentapeptide repeats